VRTLGAVAAARTPPLVDTVLFDDFTGSTIDTTKWDVYDRISDQVNSEVNCCVPANVSVSSSTLKIASRFEDHTCQDNAPASPTTAGPTLEHYTSGQIAQKTASFLYGTVTVRAKMPGGFGLWPCIWMLGDNWKASQPLTANTPAGYTGWPTGGWWEIDIAEFMGDSRTQVNNSAHYPTSDGTHINTLPFDATTRFMVYRLQWSATSLVWSVDAEDGVGFRTLRTVTDTSRIPNTPGYLIIHTAVGGNVVGTPNPATFPQTMEVDYARITQPAVYFYDDFSGSSVDTAKWDVYDRIADMANNEVNCNVAANVSVSGGTLKMVCKHEDHVCNDLAPANPDNTTPRTMNYTACQIAQKTAPFLYGTVDVRAKIAGSHGSWPCIWMLGYLWQPSQPLTANTPAGSAGHPNGGWCEIDMAEFWPWPRTLVNNGVYWNTVPNDNEIVTLPFDSTTRFMVYRLVWTATSITWQVDCEDGVGFRTTHTRTGAAGVQVPNVPMYLTIDIAVGGSAGTPDPATFPSTMEIDYARITQ
jgi:beta-glucanase (GH16 family)